MQNASDSHCGWFCIRVPLRCCRNSLRRGLRLHRIRNDGQFCAELLQLFGPQNRVEPLSAVLHRLRWVLSSCTLPRIGCVSLSASLLGQPQRNSWGVSGVHFREAVRVVSAAEPRGDGFGSGRRIPSDVHGWERGELHGKILSELDHFCGFIGHSVANDPRRMDIPIHPQNTNQRLVKKRSSIISYFNG